MLDCDECHRWFHGVCAGFVREQAIMEYWACDECVMRKQLVAQKERVRARRAAGAANAFAAKASSSSSDKGKSLETGPDLCTSREAEAEKGLREFVLREQSMLVQTYFFRKLETTTSSHLRSRAFLVSILFTAVFRQLLLNFVTEKAYDDTFARTGRRMLLARWSSDAVVNTDPDHW